MPRLLVLAIPALACLLAPPTWATETGSVVRVVDGDTIIVEVAGRHKTVPSICAESTITDRPSGRFSPAVTTPVVPLADVADSPRGVYNQFRTRSKRRWATSDC